MLTRLLQRERERERITYFNLQCKWVELLLTDDDTYLLSEGLARGLSDSQLLQRLFFNRPRTLQQAEGKLSSRLPLLRHWMLTRLLREGTTTCNVQCKRLFAYCGVEAERQRRLGISSVRLRIQWRQHISVYLSLFKAKNGEYWKRKCYCPDAPFARCIIVQSDIDA
ncbi:hypothetical protein AVEN_217553-1 [Araneus ventricosus]|uniref:Uncharacterized protein n=1 Tax=Araneus ventricosus TaxID=182803 RepID=A0A4Y2WNE8_ARAVE|nr:hypothetical protein AVEN_215746-1 [Araneus ventricosus]GBO38281.1 hypothetical protein AVEN_217553-1 [Araneus ventricosus]